MHLLDAIIAAHFCTPSISLLSDCEPFYIWVVSPIDSESPFVLCNWLHITLFLRDHSLCGFSHIRFSTYKFGVMRFVLTSFTALKLC